MYCTRGSSTHEPFKNRGSQPQRGPLVGKYWLGEGLIYNSFEQTGEGFVVADANLVGSDWHLFVWQPWHYQLNHTRPRMRPKKPP